MFDNFYTGEIPVEYGNFAALKVFDVSQNNLTDRYQQVLQACLRRAGKILTIMVFTSDLDTFTDLNNNEVLDGLREFSVFFNQLSIDTTTATALSPYPQSTGLYLFARGYASWTASQTLPTNISLTALNLSFDPIAYQDDFGGYEIGVADSIDGPFEPYTVGDLPFTVDKTVDTLLLPPAFIPQIPVGTSYYLATDRYRAASVKSK